MSWIRRELANERYWSEPDWQVDVESSEMREEIGLRYYLEPGDEKLAPEELGRRIDDCLVEYINTSLQRLKGRVISRAGEEDIIIKRDITIEEFESRRRKIDEGMKEDPALQAFEGTEKRGEKLPLASRTYLKLARRHALFGGKRPPHPPKKVVILLLFCWITSGKQAVGRLTGTDRALSNVWQTRGWIVATLANSRNSSRTPLRARSLGIFSIRTASKWSSQARNCLKSTYSGT